MALTGSLGLDDFEPVLRVEHQDERVLRASDTGGGAGIISEHVCQGRKVERFVIGLPKERSKCRLSFTCAGARGACISCGCLSVRDALEQELQRQGLSDGSRCQTGCVGSCDLGPVMIVYPDEVFYQKGAPPTFPSSSRSIS